MAVRLATPVEAREALELAVTLTNHRVRYVSVPVLSDEDYDQMLSLSLSRLGSLIDRAEAEEARS